MSNNKNFVEFDFEIKQAQKLINAIEKQSYNIQRKAMATGGRYIAQQVRRSYTDFFSNPPQRHDKSAMPGREKGEPENLKKSIKNKAYRRPKLGQVIYSNVHAFNPYNPSAPKVLYGAALAKGFTITAKNDKYLTFQVDGKWKKKKEVTVAKRPWVREPADRAAHSQEIVRKMEETTQKELQKLEKKYAEKRKNK